MTKQRLFLFYLCKLGLLEKVVAKKRADFFFLGQLFSFAFAVVAAEADLSAFNFNLGSFFYWATRVRASLLFNLLGEHELQVGFRCELFLVAIKRLCAVAAAEINLAIFVISRLVFIDFLSRDRAFDFVEVNFRV